MQLVLLRGETEKYSLMTFAPCRVSDLAADKRGVFCPSLLTQLDGEVCSCPGIQMAMQVVLL